MKAYQNGITKEQFVSEMKMHQKMDNFKSGTYGEGIGTKACAIGCGVQSIARIEGLEILNFGDHALVAEKLGCPEWLIRLEDRIFEGVGKERQKTWPLEFAESLQEGTDTSKILIPMLIFIVEFAREKTKNNKTLAAIDGILSELRKEKIDKEKLMKARVKALAAADAAVDADADDADAAAAYAAAYSAAYSADTAAAYSAAYAAAYSAAYSAEAGTFRQNAYNKFADKLLGLMTGLKERSP
jgi:hypothetical protein